MSDPMELTDLRNCEAHAWRLLHERVRRVAVPFKRSLGEEWEDAAQEAEIRLLRALRDGRLDHDSGLESFIWRVTRNACIDQLRRQKVRGALAQQDAAELGDLRDSPNVLAARFEQRMQLDKSFQLLPEECRSLLFAIEQGRSYSELAEQLGISPGALRVRVHRCRERARNRFALMTTPIVGAAERLFLKRGYLQTPLPLIAETAGVPVAEVENLFVDKPRILLAIVERKASGTQGMSEEEVDITRPIRMSVDPLERIDLALRVTARGYSAGLGDIYQVVKQAAAADHSQEALLHRLRATQAHTGKLLIESVREGLGASREPIAAMVEAAIEIDGPATYQRLKERGWSLSDMHEWKVQQMSALVLG